MDSTEHPGGAPNQPPPNQPPANQPQGPAPANRPQGPAPYQPPSYPAPWQSPAAPAGRPGAGLAVASLLLGLFGLVLSWFVFGIPSLLAVVLGAVAARRAGVSPGSRAMAITGLVLGLVPVVILAGFAVLLAAGYLAAN